MPHRQCGEVRRSRDDRGRPSRSRVRARGVQRGDAAALAERRSVAERSLLERGQIVQLREGLERLSTRSKGGAWPEYAELDCFSCHHSLTRPENSWRQELGYRDRRPGNPPWNHARFAVARHVARVADAGSADALESQIQNLANEVSKLQADRTRVASATTAVQGRSMRSRVGSLPRLSIARARCSTCARLPKMRIALRPPASAPPSRPRCRSKRCSARSRRTKRSIRPPRAQRWIACSSSWKIPAGTTREDSRRPAPRDDLLRI